MRHFSPSRPLPNPFSLRKRRDLMGSVIAMCSQ